jgi:hemolysin activation/secretion protein
MCWATLAVPAAAQQLPLPPPPDAVQQQGSPTPQVEPERQAEGRRAPDRFAINAIDVTGVTQLSAAEVERIIYRFTGPDRSGQDVEAARLALQAAYTTKGFESVVVEIPGQSTDLFNQGIVEIRVSEVPLGKVQVVESRFHSDRVVRTQLSSLVEGQPLDFKALQTELNAANRFPDREVTPRFKPGAVPGTLDIDLAVKDKFPLHSSFELNNDNNPSTTRLRLSGSVRYTDLWRAGHSLSASFVIAPDRKSDSSVISGSYTAPLIGSPWTLLLYGYKSNSNIAALGGTNVLGNGYQIGARAIYRLPAKDSVQSISIGPDFKDFEQDILVGGINAASTPVRYVPLVAEYTLAGGDDASAFAKSVGVTSFDANIGVTLGLRAVKRLISCVDRTSGLDVPIARCTTDPIGFVFVDQFRNREIDSVENFVHFNAGFNYAIATKSDFVMAMRWSAQLADSHLVTNEQFAIGGSSTVRGYFQSEAVGDDGFVTSFELQAPSLAPVLGKSVDELRVFGFVDSGYTRTRRALPGQLSEFRLLSVGGGARFGIFDRLSGEVVVGVPLRAGTVSKKGEPRTVFVVRGEF